MRRALQEIIGSRAVATPMDIERFMRSTLLAATTDWVLFFVSMQRPLMANLVAGDDADTGWCVQHPGHRG